MEDWTPETLSCPFAEFAVESDRQGSTNGLYRLFGHGLLVLIVTIHKYYKILTEKTDFNSHEVITHPFQ